MLKQQASFFRNASILVDFLVLALALWLAYLTRQQAGGLLQPFLGHSWILLFAAPIWYLLLARYEFYISLRRINTYEILTRLVNVHLLGGFPLAAVILFLDKHEYSRGVFIGFIFYSFVLLSLEKVCLRKLLTFFRRRGFNTRHLIIVGTKEKAKRLCQLLDEHKDWGLEVLGFVQVEKTLSAKTVSGHPVLGHATDLVEICKKHPVDEVVFCLPKAYVLNTEDYLRDLEELGITVRVLLDFYDVYYSKRELSLLHNELPFLTFHTRSLDAHQLFLKRMLDIAGALVGLGIFAVFLPFLAWAIRRDSPGPIFFSQNRVGQSGRIFTCWKLRSMSIDAEEQKKGLMAQNQMKGAIFKIKDDPRITRIGKFLRKTSLDEFPQFWNVLRGDMSLVGTRPPTPTEVAQYENWHRRRITIKPGITGKWQVSGRNRIEDFDAIVRLDLDYIDNWCIWLDIKILLRTLIVVFRREGSC